MKVKLKFWLFGNYWWIFIFLYVLFFSLIISSDIAKRWELLISITTILITSFFFIQKQRIEELRVFQNAFKEFNRRYDKLNDDLNRIYKEYDGSTIKDTDRAKLYGYFNLCGEEYFYYKLRYIYPEVWESWVNGMKHFYSQSHIQKMWDEELRQNSYYHFESQLLK